MTDRPAKLHSTTRLTDRDIEEGEQEAAYYRAVISGANLALARSLDKLLREDKP